MVKDSTLLPGAFSFLSRHSGADMQADDIKHLADILAQHPLNDIEQSLRVISISLRNATDSVTINGLKHQQCLFLTAREFLKTHTITDGNWRQSFACFEQLTDWFDSATHIENHQRLSVLSWFLQLEGILSSKIPARDIMVLGAAFFSEPNKFVAFIHWLLENGISPREIEGSRILHQYFAYHICDIAVLHQTYALLSNLSEKGDIFLEHARTTPSQMRGFMNQMQEDGTLRSYNVMGELFAHNLNFEMYDERTLKKLEFHVQFQDMHVPLFDLFGWAFINALNFKVQCHREILKQLILSSVGQKIREVLPQYILSGQFMPAVGQMMLSMIGSVAPRLPELIKSEPFYMHGVKKSGFRSLGFSDAEFKEIIQTLCTDVKYQNMYHLPYLVTLSKNLNEDSCFLLGEYSSSPEHRIVLEAIFGLLLQSGSSLLDTDFELIIPIKQELFPLFRDKMRKYSDNIEAAIKAFNQQMIDYEAVLQLWGSQLSHVNLFKRMYPLIINERDYPFTVYQLPAKILQDNYEACALEDRSFEPKPVLDAISTDPDRRIRIMQEALLAGSICEAVMEAILNLVLELNLIEQCIMQPFGNEQGLFYHAVTSKNDRLHRMLSRKLSFTEEHYLRITQIAIETHDRGGLANLLTSIELTDVLYNKMIGLLLVQLMTAQLEPARLEDYRGLLHSILMSTSKNVLVKKNVTSIFYLGVRHADSNLIKVTCCFSGENALTALEIKRAIKQVAERGEWGVLELLCGLKTDITLNPDIIQPGNVELYLKMVERHRQTFGDDFIDSPFEVTNSNGESLLHIAANHCSFQIFQACFGYLRKHLSKDEIEELLEMKTASGETLHCYKESCDQKKINDYIEMQREQYCHSDRAQTSSGVTFFDALRRQRENDDSTENDLEHSDSTESLLATDHSTGLTRHWS